MPREAGHGKNFCFCHCSITSQFRLVVVNGFGMSMLTQERMHRVANHTLHQILLSNSCAFMCSRSRLLPCNVSM